MRLSNILLIGLISLGAALSGCGGDDNVVQDEGPEALYERGVDSMSSGNFPIALTRHIDLCSDLGPVELLAHGTCPMARTRHVPNGSL